MNNSPTPWGIHRTGSQLGIKDAQGKFVVRKVVNMVTVADYNQLLADFQHIVACVNHSGLPASAGDSSQRP